jgi:hypothetical protein
MTPMAVIITEGAAPAPGPGQQPEASRSAGAGVAAWHCGLRPGTAASGRSEPPPGPARTRRRRRARRHESRSPATQRLGNRDIIRVTDPTRSPPRPGIIESGTVAGLNLNLEWVPGPDAAAAGCPGLFNPSHPVSVSRPPPARALPGDSRLLRWCFMHDTRPVDARAILARRTLRAVLRSQLRQAPS